jgi:ABC-type multidrug transport system fused ATPase/permease subunit
MSALQTLVAVVVLIFVLSVIVQAIQEIIKSLLNTKAQTMEETIEKFMGNHLTLPQVQSALQVRGLDITALEHFNKDDFRHLLDGIELAAPQVQGIVASTTATAEEAKNNIAAAYEAARVSFQKTYTTKNKMFAVIISFIVVLALNASLIRIYEILAADQSMSQAIAGTATTILNSEKSAQGNSGSVQPPDLAQAYSTNRKTIDDDLQKYPILLRTLKYPDDLRDEKFGEIAGLFLMGLLVSLGAPFWNDVLKGVTGVNNVLNTGGKKAS